MRSLYLRIYLTVVTALALFALVSGWLVQRHLDQERSRVEGALQDRMAAWGELLQRSLPGVDAPEAEQADALREWAERLRLPMALDDAAGRRVAVSEAYARRERHPAGGPPGSAPGAGPEGLPGAGGGPGPPSAMPQAIRLDDGRTLWVLRPGLRRGAPRGPGSGEDLAPPWWPLRGLPEGLGLAALLVVLFAAVAAGAYPVVRRLTRRLESLKQGVEAFGAGALHQRVAEDGRDEVAALGASFNRAAGRIEALLRSHQSLLANASHELRSPLARLKMAVALLEDTTPVARLALQREIDANIAELDALVEEVLLASRLDGAPAPDRQEAVELLPLAAEEAARAQAELQGVEGSDALVVQGDERLLRRALRNLLENARRYGGDEVELTLGRLAGAVEIRVCDRGPGVPEAYRERIFEAFFRLPGHAEREGGVGLGLALVRQIAVRHGGSVRCEPRPGGGSCFTLSLPATD
jgi:signal transduction histidine kinase